MNKSVRVSMRSGGGSPGGFASKGAPAAVTSSKDSHEISKSSGPESKPVEQPLAKEAAVPVTQVSSPSVPKVEQKMAEKTSTSKVPEPVAKRAPVVQPPVKQEQVVKHEHAIKQDPVIKQEPVVKQGLAKKQSSPVPAKKAPVAVPSVTQEKKNNQHSQKSVPQETEKEAPLFSPVLRRDQKKAQEPVAKTSQEENAQNKESESDTPLFSSYTRKKQEPATEVIQPSVATTPSQSNPAQTTPKESLAVNQQASAVSQPSQVDAQKAVKNSSVADAYPGKSSSPALGSGDFAGGDVEQETVPFALEQGSLDHAIVREIWRHYRKPPGFEEHDPFVFTFEIRNRKAVAIGARGAEPLIIYTAIKDAVLKATFEHSSTTSKRVELLIS